MSCTRARPAGRPDALLRLFHDARQIQRGVDTMTGLLLATLLATIRVDLGVSSLRTAALRPHLALQFDLARRHLVDGAARLGIKLLCALALAARAAPRV